ncbi:hypothetical protein F4778DRAFT_433598 [Xylariomycetidae sp. FL2044]|nr:hypothetical protein F4778DRAFT_433598 [Xylariomycetidae sp. FL2044]
MDPLSITASVIALVQAVGAITKGSRTIADLRKAPEEYRDLLGEIINVQDYLSLLHTVIETGASSGITSHLNLKLVNSALAQIEGTIQDLQIAMKQVEKDSTSTDGTARVSKIKWQLYSSRVAQIRKNLRMGKQALVDAIGLLQLAHGFSQSRLLAGTDAGTLKPAQVPDTTTNDLVINDTEAATGSTGTFTLVQSTCRGICPCRCHKDRSSRNGTWLSSAVKSLLTPLSIPTYWDSRQCDHPACRSLTAQSVMIFCQLPYFQVAVASYVKWASLNGSGVNLHVRIARVTHNSHDSTWAVQTGNLRRLRYLMETRRAYPNDMTDLGWSLLMYAVAYKQGAVINYLLNLGADKYHSDRFGRSPLSMAAGRYTKKVKRNAPIDVENFGELLPIVKNSIRDLPGECILHELLLQHRFDEFQCTLKANPLLLDNTEPHEGMTPLHVAVQVMSIEAVQALLLARADANLEDDLGHTPLSLAAYCSFDEGVQLLIPYTRDLNREGHGNVLHYAIRYCRPNTIRILIEAGADVQAVPYGTSPDLAFNHVAQRDRHSPTREEELEDIGRQLLKAGVNINQRDDGNLRPVERTILFDDAQAFKVFRKLGAVIDPWDLNGRLILHWAGSWATSNFFQALRQDEISGLDPDQKYGGFPAMEYFDYRMQCREEHLYALQSRPTEEDRLAFITLLDEFRERNRGLQYGPQLREAYAEESLSGGKDGVSAMPGAWIDGEDS